MTHTNCVSIEGLRVENTAAVDVALIVCNSNWIFFDDDVVLLCDTHSKPLQFKKYRPFDWNLCFFLNFNSIFQITMI